MTIEQDLLNVVSAANDLTQTVQTKVTEIDAAVDAAVNTTVTNTNNRIAQLDQELVDFKAQSAYGINAWHKYVIDLSEGRPDMFYPVSLRAPADSSGSESEENMIHEMQIYRRYSATPRPAADNGYVNYNGTHWLGFQCRIQTTGGGWDGGPNWTRVVENTYSYRPAMAAIRMGNRGDRDVYVWLRGGCNYGFATSYPGTPIVRCMDGIPDRVHTYNRGTYLEETWVNAATITHFTTARDLYEARELANGTDPKTVNLNKDRHVCYYENDIKNSQRYSWEHSSYQDAVQDLENAFGWTVWGSSTGFRSTDVEPINDQEYLANAWCRAIATSQFPNRASGKGVMEYFTADEVEITMNLDDYVAP